MPSLCFRGKPPPRTAPCAFYSPCSGETQGSFQSCSNWMPSPESAGLWPSSQAGTGATHIHPFGGQLAVQPLYGGSPAAPGPATCLLTLGYPLLSPFLFNGYNICTAPIHFLLPDLLFFLPFFLKLTAWLGAHSCNTHTLMHTSTHAHTHLCTHTHTGPGTNSLPFFFPEEGKNSFTAGSPGATYLVLRPSDLGLQFLSNNLAFTWSGPPSVPYFQGCTPSNKTTPPQQGHTSGHKATLSPTRLQVHNPSFTTHQVGIKHSNM